MRIVKLLAIVMLVFLPFSIVTGGSICMERPPSGGTFLVTLDVCHQGQGGIANQEMQFILECSDALFHMDSANPFNHHEHVFKPLLLSSSKDRPPSFNLHS